VSESISLTTEDGTVLKFSTKWPIHVDEIEFTNGTKRQAVDVVSVQGGNIICRSYRGSTEPVLPGDDLRPRRPEERFVLRMDEILGVRFSHYDGAKTGRRLLIVLLSVGAFLGAALVALNQMRF
jgi:hypothetical protein